MTRDLLCHGRAASECPAAFAAWTGFESPLRLATPRAVRGSGIGDAWHPARIFVKEAGIDANVTFGRWVDAGKTETVHL